MRCHILWHLIWVYTVYSGLSKYTVNKVLTEGPDGAMQFVQGNLNLNISNTLDYTFLLVYLTFTTLSGLIQQMTNWWYFSNFSQKVGFNVSCKLSPMKCQIPFSGKNKKNISKCHLLKILPRVLRVNQQFTSLKIMALMLKRRQIFFFFFSSYFCCYLFLPSKHFNVAGYNNIMLS